MTPAVTYSFYVTATNFNGEGEASDTVRLISCVRPQNVRPPTLVETTASTVELRWAAPEDGGCPISSYSILSDKGVAADGFVHNLESASIVD